MDILGDEVSTPQHGDIFEKDPASALHSLDGAGARKEVAQELPEGFDNLPIELISLIDRCGPCHIGCVIPVAKQLR